MRLVHKSAHCNGASQLSETYGDWTLNCSTGMKACTLSQALVNKGGQRAFLIELRVAKDGASEGTILMPFGLKLEAGVLLKLDDKNLGQGLRFSTCVAQGCVLPVNFPIAGMNAIRNGKALAVGALNMSDGELMTFRYLSQWFRGRGRSPHPASELTPTKYFVILVFPFP